VRVLLVVAIVAGMLVQDIALAAEERLSQEACNAAVTEFKAKYTASDYSSLFSTISSLSTSSIFRYVAGSDSVINDMKESFGSTSFVDELDRVKGKLDSGQKQYWLEKAKYDVFLVKNETEKFFGAKSEFKPLSSRVTKCLNEGLYFGNTNPGQYDALSKSSFRKGRFGHFTIGLNYCEIKSSVGTGSRYSEPDAWVGSRFVVIDATFKNEDSEGRLPSEGSLVIITPDRKELRYDTTESVMKRGYGIYFKSVNPLVVMPTKIVYRIPDEITGEVLWEPGRNPDGKRLWCSFVQSTK